MVVLGIAIGMMFTISPLWIGETCRPELRGFFLCFFNTSIVFGQFAMYVFQPTGCNGFGETDQIFQRRRVQRK